MHLNMAEAVFSKNVTNFERGCLKTKFTYFEEQEEMLQETITKEGICYFLEPTRDA